MIATVPLEFSPVNLTTPGDEPNSGVMVAWVPSSEVAQQFVIDAPNAEPANRMHMTIAFLGKAVDLSAAQRVTALSVVKDYADRLKSFSAKVSGTGLFECGDDGTALVALIDAPELPSLYVGLVTALEVADVEVSHTHGFTPHVTCAYLSNPDSVLRAPSGFEFTIDNLSLVVSDEGESFRLQ